MSDINLKRRHLLGSTLFGIAAANLPFIGTSHAQPAQASALTSMAPLKYVNAGVLNIAYYEAGPAQGPVVLLLHGYPYDIHSYIDVAAILAARGCRVIVPHLRGHGGTTFLDSATLRTGQQSAVALDIIALMDALKIDKAVMAGYDWGARTACIIAALWPERCIGLLSVNGYLIQNIARNALPLPAQAEVGWWYQYYFATERGVAGLTANRKDIARIIWKTNSPTWHFDEATFNRAAASFDNPDYVAIVIHNYRWRLSLAAGDPQYDALEKRLAVQPAIAIPTITMDGDADGVVPATDGKSYASKFTGPRSHRIIKGAGHNLPQEAPREFSDAVMTLLGNTR
ncbi:Haloalkane dehalogenase [compost metagenome]